MKKRLMAFLLAVVTTVGSLPMAPVFAEEDEFVEVVVEDEEVVIEDAGNTDYTTRALGDDILPKVWVNPNKENELKVETIAKVNGPDLLKYFDDVSGKERGYYQYFTEGADSIAEGRYNNDPTIDPEETYYIAWRWAGPYKDVVKKLTIKFSQGEKWFSVERGVADDDDTTTTYVGQVMYMSLDQFIGTELDGGEKRYSDASDKTHWNDETPFWTDAEMNGVFTVTLFEGDEEVATSEFCFAGDTENGFSTFDVMTGVKAVSGNQVLAGEATFEEGSKYEVSFTASDAVVSGDVAIKSVASDKEAVVKATKKSASIVEFEAVAAGSANVDVVVEQKNGTTTVSECACKLAVTVVSKNSASENKSDTSEEEKPAEVIDYEALAEAKKDAEGFSAFSSYMDIDPEAAYQEIVMVAKQSFTSDALKGFNYADTDKAAVKANKKILTISKKGKITAKSVKENKKVVLAKDGRIISVNVVKPVMPTKKDKISVDGGATETVKISGLDGVSVNVVFISSDPTKASVSYDSAKREAYVTGISKGKVNVVAYVNGKTYKTPVTVKSNAPKTFVGYINKGVKKKTIKASGVKRWEIISGNAVTVVKNKFNVADGVVSGNVIVNGFDKKKGGEVIVSGNLIVQDLDLKLSRGKSASINGIDVNAGYADNALENKTKEKKRGANKTETYEITMTLADQKNGVDGKAVKKAYAKFEFANYDGQPVVFKSSKAANVYVNGNGVIVARKAQKKAVTLSAKVNGKTIKIKVFVKDAAQ